MRRVISTSQFANALADARTYGMPIGETLWRTFLYGTAMEDAPGLFYCENDAVLEILSQYFTISN